MTEKSTLTGSTGRDGRFRPVTHTKSKVTLYGGLGSGNVLPLNTPQYLTEVNLVAAQAIALANSRHNNVVNNHAAPLGVNWSALGSDALFNMLPSLSGDFSALNFIYELRDFKSLGKSLLRLFTAVKNKFWIKFRDLMSIVGADVLWTAYGSKPWDKPYKKAAGAYLAWKFAWQPFVSDCKKLVKGIISLKEKIKQYERRANQDQQRYWGKTINGSFSANTGVAYNVSSSVLTTNGTYLSTTPGTYRFTAVMRYRYHMSPDMLAIAKGLGGALDALGVTANPAIIWNAIPFSFIVDWFVSVGGYLEKLRVANSRPVVEISDFCSSVKSVREYKDTFTSKLGYSSYQRILAQNSGIYTRTEYYERRVGVPSLYTFNDTGGVISGTKAALTGALLSVNVPTFKMGRGHY